MKVQYTIKTVLSSNKCFYSTSVVRESILLSYIAGFWVIDEKNCSPCHLCIKMHWSQNFSKNHTSRWGKQTTQNSSSTVKNSKLPHLQQIANFHIFAPGKHLQFSQQIRLLAPIHFFFLSPPLIGKKITLLIFRKPEKYMRQNYW